VSACFTGDGQLVVVSNVTPAAKKNREFYKKNVFNFFEEGRGREAGGKREGRGGEVGGKREGRGQRNFFLRWY
jgi:hypothetical protein